VSVVDELQLDVVFHGILADQVERPISGGSGRVAGTVPLGGDALASLTDEILQLRMRLVMLQRIVADVVEAECFERPPADEILALIDEARRIILGRAAGRVAPSPGESARGQSPAAISACSCAVFVTNGARGAVIGGAYAAERRLSAAIGSVLGRGDDG
jgi:hypothetical protein